MSRHIDCDHCGRPIKHQGLHVGIVKAKAGAFVSPAEDRDFCGEACLAAYYAKRTGQQVTS